MADNGDIRNAPAYADGYSAALDGEPLVAGTSEAYQAGWQAACRAMEILRNAGFERRDDGSFGKTFTIGGRDAAA